MPVRDGAQGGPGLVTADDLAHGVALTVAMLRQPAALEADWSRPAGSLTWDCWETAEHLADDLFAYAAELGSPVGATPEPVPFVLARTAPDKPRSTIFAQRDAGPSGLLRVLESCGALLVAMVRTAPPEARAFHGFGIADAEGSAAMGLVETLVHADDLAQGLGIAWEAPADLCARVLHRLFPDAPGGFAPWPTLLWAAGRGELPGLARQEWWRWDSSVR
ncbi:maleylpyruvate isomerase N-terminal domain-containing protein [Streptacidiphilus jiangxiensis]|uniref:Mycothiol maleylpyruvate isomerase N-terminal domain-containing protein n=1 Tax=Streptacidiphilus jiangxiensis TaxID=235985 RepID=A0A1H7KM26_STRJI|nr:maleylpyruvate isomerase N-terminal domain-containing protein [Streptacidiphilus jiangxiensis]SEK87566.1 hypothetical protein SAMN05414137_104102 [Streptacidiphilus jiangxiensis]